jgi:hypothetical protein
MRIIKVRRKTDYKFSTNLKNIKIIIYNNNTNNNHNDLI